jgi:hypothetical protein
MITQRRSLASFTVAILLSLTAACGSKAPEQTTRTSPETYSPIASQDPATPADATGATETIPADLRFSPADINYLNSLDPAARELAVQHRREDLQALRASAKLTNGYTDSLKNWSITTK